MPGFCEYLKVGIRFEPSERFRLRWKDVLTQGFPSRKERDKYRRVQRDWENVSLIFLYFVLKSYV